MRALPGISGQVTHPPHHPSELILTCSNSQRAAYKLAFRNLRGVLPVALASSAGGSVSVDAGAFARHAKDRNSPRGRFGGRRHGGVVPRPDVMALDPRLMRVRRVVQDRVHLFGNERSLFFLYRTGPFRDVMSSCLSTSSTMPSKDNPHRPSDHCHSCV